MADKKVNVIISLKDGVTSGLKSIQSGISATADAFKKVAIAGGVMGAAIVGGLVAVAKAFAESETASKRLANTFTALGEDGNKAAEMWGAYAEQMMKVTTLDDEVVLGLVAQAKTMGVANENIKAVTEGAIGLSEAMGVDLSQALKMSAMAMNGEYTMMERGNAAMRAATTDAEKAAIAQRLMAQGLEMAKQKGDTVAGSWQRLKTSWSEALEQVGRVLFGDGSLTDGLKKAKEWLDNLVGSSGFNEWALKLKDNLTLAADAMKILVGGSSEQRADVWTAIVGVIKGGLIDAGNGLLAVLAKGLPILGEALGAAVMGVVKNFGQDNATEDQQKAALDLAKREYATGGSQAVDKKYNELISGAESRNREDRLSKEGLTLSDKFKGGGELAKALNELQAITDRRNEENKTSDDAHAIKRKAAEEIAAKERDASEQGMKDALEVGKKLAKIKEDGANKKVEMEAQAQKEHDATVAKIKSTPQAGGFRSLAESMIGKGKSVYEGKATFDKALKLAGGKDALKTESGRENMQTALSLLSEGKSVYQAEQVMKKINELSGSFNSKAGAVPAEETNRLLVEQNAILKERLGGVK